jgi:RNA polymerase sigma-70 factor, ECF subfamily
MPRSTRVDLDQMSLPQRPEISSRVASQEEFLRLLLPLRDRLAHYARAVSRTREEADDLVSDAILAALEGFERLRNREVFASYLFRIASRLQKRRRWRRKLFGEYDEERAHAIGSNGPSPESAAEVVMLHRALAALPDAQREAVVLFEISDLSLEEIREIQGGSLSAVKSRISRGRQQLARLLGVTEDERETATATKEASKSTNGHETTMGGMARESAPRGEGQLIYTGPRING